MGDFAGSMAAVLTRAAMQPAAVTAASARFGANLAQIGASPPWINKYYIMGLAPGRSFLEWAVQHKRTVFTISWRNPGPG